MSDPKDPRLKLTLTLSGLSVVTLESKDPMPTHPDAVDVLCAAAPMHRARLAYWPNEVGGDLPPSTLHIDPEGRKHAAIDLDDRCVEIAVTNNRHASFDLAWDPKSPKTPQAGQEHLMNWIPSVTDLGIASLNVPTGASDIPPGASVRLALPPGSLKSRTVLVDGSGSYLPFQFPATNREAAIANELVYETAGDGLTVSWGRRSLYFASGDIELCLSNDVDRPATDYTSAQTELEHFAHLDVLCPAGVNYRIEPPKANSSAHTRTRKPICPLALYVYSA